MVHGVDFKNSLYKTAAFYLNILIGNSDGRKIKLFINLKIKDYVSNNVRLTPKTHYSRLWRLQYYLLV